MKKQMLRQLRAGRVQLLRKGHAVFLLQDPADLSGAEPHHPSQFPDGQLPSILPENPVKVFVKNRPIVRRM